LLLLFVLCLALSVFLEWSVGGRKMVNFEAARGG
jgi:hypothetical protein